MIIARVLCMWSQIELQLALFLALLLKAKTSEAVRVYMTLRRSTNRFAALEAASVNLDEKHKDLLQSLLRIAGMVEKERNFLAHGMYAYSDSLPDSICCCTQEAFAEWSISLLAENETIYPVPVHKSLEYLGSLFHYTLGDLARLEHDLDETHELLKAFHVILRARNDEIDELRYVRHYGRLYGNDRVQKALEAVRARTAKI
jgi:hypothetical protein